MRWLAMLALAACTGAHDPALREVRATDCVACHEPDYQATTFPVHPGALPQTCADCHTTAAWRPALAAGHPEESFPIASGAHQVECLSCHDLARGSSVGGANTVCIACHTQGPTDAVHGGVADYAFDDTQPHFCLSCHPDGRAPKHPENLFPIQSGPHSHTPCGDCHDATLGSSIGGMNVNCTGCHLGIHARSVVDPQHVEVAGYAWSDTDKQFCRRCHPRGLAEGD